MSHPFNSELKLKLISPYGTSLELSINDGGFSNNYNNTTFTDNTNDTTDVLGPFNGIYQPKGGNFISKYFNCNVNGD